MEGREGVAIILFSLKNLREQEQLCFACLFLLSVLVKPVVQVSSLKYEALPSKLVVLFTAENTRLGVVLESSDL